MLSLARTFCIKSSARTASTTASTNGSEHLFPLLFQETLEMISSFQRRLILLSHGRDGLFFPQNRRFHPLMHLFQLIVFVLQDKRYLQWVFGYSTNHEWSQHCNID